MTCLCKPIPIEKQTHFFMKYKITHELNEEKSKTWHFEVLVHPKVLYAS